MSPLPPLALGAVPSDRHRSPTTDGRTGPAEAPGEPAAASVEVVLEVAADGRVESRRRFGGAGRQEIRDQVRTADGGYVIVGGNGSRLSGTAWVARVDGSGDRIWTQALREDTATAVVRAGDGDYPVGGIAGRLEWVSADPFAGYYRYYTGWLWRLDGDGTVNVVDVAALLAEVR